MKDDNRYYQDSVTVTVKGLDIDFVKILTIFTSIDLSNNNFHGEIPRSIGDLKSLIVLNLSSNNFEGLIPPSLGKLTELESLDLSNNSLSGRIPQELASLSFLAYLNLSDNKLTGLIPQSRQFDTFLNSSFEENSGLCGSPLSKKCQGTNETPTPDHNQEAASENGFGWKAVVVGYGCGFLVGAIGGHLLFWKKPNWFVRIYGRKM
ncbi:hypothetical protein TIFTF001_013212 [Ficus carica]|uniref:Receptor-like protein 12 n=1 Tax=Ficus carica TaxID=3494 RepID=A0AA88A3Z0_FICCA|nr:hypothetical protein TIFTF001_013206 [Ficus carica]GMN44025.1 hypothetical protein TIFTF001_013212 [Ficus carica]